MNRYRIRRSAVGMMAVLLLGAAVSKGGTIYVDFNASGNDDGTSWSDAYTDLQDAIAACSGDEIWVVAGVYKPHASDRTVSFVLKDNCAIYGGFDGTESSLGERDKRPETNGTVLSGDLDGDDGPAAFEDNGENSYHVVIASGTDGTARLDGFKITGGNADGTGTNQGEGGGLFAYAGTPRIENCRFEENDSHEGGGATLEEGSDAKVVRCRFVGNRATTSGSKGKGGAMCVNASSPDVINCKFFDNEADDGGAVWLQDNSLGDPANATIVNCLFTGNSASGTQGEGGAIYSIDSEPTISNCTVRGNDGTNGGGYLAVKGGLNRSADIFNSIFWGNTDTYGGEHAQIFGFTGAVPNVNNTCIEDCDASTGFCSVGADNNIGDDPRFVSSSDDHVDSLSPTINAGNNSDITADVADLDGDSNTTEDTSLDLDENPRTHDTTVDMGSFEFRCTVNGDCEQDANQCTVHTCVSNVCTSGNKPSGRPCSDGAYCNGTETCDGAGSCGNSTGDPCGPLPELCCEASDSCYTPPELCGAE